MPQIKSLSLCLEPISNCLFNSDVVLNVRILAINQHRFNRGNKMLRAIATAIVKNGPAKSCNVISIVSLLVGLNCAIFRT